MDRLGYAVVNKCFKGGSEKLNELMLHPRTAASEVHDVIVEIK